jgi:hypothetical protein
MVRIRTESAADNTYNRYFWALERIASGACDNPMAVAKQALLASPRRSSAVHDLVGMWFGYLQVIHYAGSAWSEGARRRTWLCMCQCGELVQRSTQALRSTRNASCGCKGYAPRKKPTVEWIEGVRARSVGLPRDVNGKWIKRKQDDNTHASVEGVPSITHRREAGVVAGDAAGHDAAA